MGINIMFLTVCVIAYNEEKTLPLILADISGQDYEHSSIEVCLLYTSPSPRDTR